jgi:histidyl-tRNA synthetase
MEEKEQTKRVEAQRLKGFRDLMPTAMFVRRHVMETLRSIFELHGFAPLETPALEYAATLEGKYGEDERLMYKFEDQGKRRVGMRFDLTVPLARVVAMHLNELQFPWKRYQMGPVWRGENPQFGRYREFYQCDIDIVGSASPLADAEVLAILGEAMTKLGFTGYRVVLNNRKLLAGIARSAGVDPEQAGTIYRAVDKLDKIGPEGVREEMVKKGVPDEIAGRALGLFLTGTDVKSFADNAALLSELAGPLREDADATKGLEELRAILDTLGNMSLDLDRYKVDVTLARGLDYYTGTVYEVIVDEPKIGALGGGGRYDNLMSLFSGRDLPTVGVAFGMERIVDVMFELGMITPTATPSRALITVFDGSSESVSASLRLASELREQNIACEVYLNAGDKLGKQFAYADKLGIPYAVVLGPDEIAAGTAAVKNLKQPPPNQQTVAQGELASMLA